jgi:hypothetical protein
MAWFALYTGIIEIIMQKKYKNIFGFFMNNEVDEEMPLNLDNRPYVSGKLIRFSDKGKWDKDKQVFFHEKDFYSKAINSKCYTLAELKEFKESQEKSSNHIYVAMRVLFLVLKKCRKSNGNHLEILQSLQKSLKKEIDDAHEPYLEIFNRKLNKHLVNGIFPIKKILKRERQNVPLSRLVEMDGYCLEKMMRLPGEEIGEKAGTKQRLMGIIRKESYDTLENRFIKHFFLEIEKEYLITDGKDKYDHFYKNIKLKNLNTPQFQEIRTIHSIVPNFVLLQNALYNKFYKEYIEYSKTSSMLIRDWKYRIELLREIVILLIIEQFINEKNAFFLDITGLSIHYSFNSQQKLIEFGENLSFGLKISSTNILSLKIQRPNLDEPAFDLKITVTDYHFKNYHSKVEKEYYLYFFWEAPDDDLFLSVKKMNTHFLNTQNTGIIFYFNKNNTLEQKVDFEKIHIVPINLYYDGSFSPLLKIIRNLLIGEYIEYEA